MKTCGYPFIPKNQLDAGLPHPLEGVPGSAKVLGLPLGVPGHSWAGGKALGKNGGLKMEKANIKRPIQKWFWNGLK